MADLRGHEGRTPPGTPNSFNFMQLMGKIGKILCWRPFPPGEMAPPPRGNPGSATGKLPIFLASLKPTTFLLTPQCERTFTVEIQHLVNTFSGLARELTLN